MNEETRDIKLQVLELGKRLRFPHIRFEIKTIDFGISSHLQVRLIDEDTGFMVGHYLYNRDSYPAGLPRIDFTNTSAEDAFIVNKIFKVFGLKKSFRSVLCPETADPEELVASNKFLQGFVYWCLEGDKRRSDDIDYLIARKRCGDFMRSIYAHAIEAFLNKDEPMSAIDVKSPIGCLSLSEFNAVNNLLRESNLYIKCDTRRPEHRELLKLDSDGVFYHLYYGVPTQAAVIDSGV